VSPDSENRHASFSSALDLPYPLVSDRGGRIGKAYGMTRAGGFLPGKRATVVIDAEGLVTQVIQAELDIKHHAREALKAVARIAAG